MNARISFVIPHFERPELLQETLSSIQKQSIRDWEAIVVDDGSTDTAWSLAQKFNDKRVRYLRRTDGIKGPSRCRNVGWQAATTENIIFVDSDDLVAPWCAEQRLLRSTEKVGTNLSVFPVLLFQSAPGDSYTLWNTFHEPCDLERFLASDPCWHTSSVLWRRSALKQIGGFNEKVMYGDDSDLHIRALYSKLKIVKFCEELPDAFVRRADHSRITNTINAKLITSRLNRLTEGSKLVNQFGSNREKRIWSGQYFQECEFLLFKYPNSRKEQQDVLRAWFANARLSRFQRIMIGKYLAVANRCRTRAYFMLRVARRACLATLPPDFFPSGPGNFESAQLTEPQKRQLQDRLAR